MIVGYIGFSITMLRYMISYKNFEVKCCFCENNRHTDELQQLCKENNIEYLKIENENDLLNNIKKKGIVNYIMYECGMIIPEKVIECVNIYNFHPGSLENNRGRTPIINSILRGDSYTKMSVYQIGVAIDSGREIASSIIKIEQEDDSRDVKEKLENTIPELLEQLDVYLSIGKYQDIGGIYCPKIQQGDYTINLKEDTLEKVSRKIRSQALYKGAVLQGQFIEQMAVDEYRWELVKDEEGELQYKVIAEVTLKKSKGTM